MAAQSDYQEFHIGHQTPESAPRADERMRCALKVCDGSRGPGVEIVLSHALIRRSRINFHIQMLKIPSCVKKQQRISIKSKAQQMIGHLDGSNTSSVFISISSVTFNTPLLPTPFKKDTAGV